MLCGIYCKNETNVLSYFSGCLAYNSVIIEEKCLDLKLNDPIKYFESEDFLNISQDALTKIGKQHKMNCSPKLLKIAILRWMKENTEYQNTNIFTNETYEFVEHNLKLQKWEFQSIL
jgi:hypothetical protein